MKLAIFGLTVSSSWGNGHATLWRGLWKALAKKGHRIAFFERNVPYYAQHRDVSELPGGSLHLYADWEGIRGTAKRELRDADIAMVTSYCPDAIAATQLALSSPAAARVFYDLDTPVTLSRLDAGEQVPYLPSGGLGDFDLVLSYTGGRALTELRARLGAREVAPLYGHVDPEVHRPIPAPSSERADLSYLGTYAPDRQDALERLFVEPARQRPTSRFAIAGAQYPESFPWTDNIYFLRHLAPSKHAAFYATSRLTLNITREAMAQMGYCPSGRLFEAAACGTALLSDRWDGLDEFYRPGEEILCASSTADALAALDCSDAEIARISRAARDRTLAEHTAEHRAETLVGYLHQLVSGSDRAMQGERA